jgi:hypothetical protein
VLGDPGCGGQDRHGLGVLLVVHVDECLADESTGPPIVGLAAVTPGRPIRST